jgi:serine/threonine-protein kinase
MDVSARDPGVYAFGRFRLDRTHRTLTCDGTIVKLVPRLFDLLLYLVENPGRVIEKDELLSAVWGRRIVEESNLSQAISGLRKVLQAEGAADTMIVTAPGRGYRFAASVTLETDAAAPFALPFTRLETEADVPAIPMRASPWWRSRHSARLAGLGSLVAACLGLWLWHATRQAPPPPFAPPPHSVAVLAFSNMTGDPTQTYFSDGLSEELINALARLDALHVAARTSAFSFRDSHATIADIGRRLNVGAVLEGSVRREGARLRIAADLIDTATGFMLWTHAYDTGQSGTLTVQSEIAGAVTEALRVTLGAAETGRLALGGTQNPAAYDAFLHGIAAQRRGDEAGWTEARQTLTAAITLDPQYADAHAALSRALNWIASSGTSNDSALIGSLKDQALAEANRAVALAPTLAAGYASRAAVLEDRLDFGQAYDAVRRAAELGPGDAAVLLYYGQLASRMGHTGEGEAAVRRGLALDPISARSFMALAVVCLIDRRYDEALEALQHMQVIAGRMPPIAAQLTTVIALTRGHWTDALRLAAQTQGWPQSEYQAIAYHALGRQPEADAAFARLQGLQGENANFQYAEIYAQWHQPDRALDALDAAYRQQDAGLVDLRSSPFLDPIRTTARYADLLQRLHIPK